MGEKVFKKIKDEQGNVKARAPLAPVDRNNSNRGRSQSAQPADVWWLASC